MQEQQLSTFLDTSTDQISFLDAYCTLWDIMNIISHVLLMGKKFLYTCLMFHGSELYLYFAVEYGYWNILYKSSTLDTCVYMSVVHVTLLNTQLLEPEWSKYMLADLTISCGSYTASSGKKT